MATTPMWRTRVIVTGVAGSPYYYTGYFNADQLEAQDALTDWCQFIIPSNQDILSGTTYTPDLSVMKIDPVTGDQVGEAAAATPGPVSGSASGTALPFATTLIARWRTPYFFNGRRLQGRTNLSGFTTANLGTGGAFTNTTRDTVATRANALIGKPNSEFVVWSKKNGLHIAVTSAVVSTKPGVLRSRRD